MKRLTYLLTLFCATLFVACSNGTNEDMPEAAPDSLCTFTVNLTPQFTMEAMTRAITSDLTSLCTNIDVYFTNTNNKMLVAQVNQVNTDPGFGSITVGLPKGTYNIYVIAYNSGTTQRCGDTHYGLVFANYFGADAFSIYHTSVGITSDMQETWELKRIVSKFSLILTDNRIPNAVTKMRLKMNNISTTYVCADGANGNATTDYIYKDFDITTHEEKNFDLIVFPKVTSTTNNLSSGSCNIVVEALKSDGSVFESRTFEGVTMGIGYLSKFTGAFFSPTYNSFTFTINPTWEELTVNTF